jgi:general secretion pathway protein G
VELLVVVVVLGILAAIVIPQYGSSTEGARVASMSALLRTLREQFEIYKIQHDNQYPRLDALWDSVTQTSDAAGNPDPDGTLGPYLMQPPRNPYTLGTNIVAMGSGSARDGWEYDEGTGAIVAVGFDEQTGSYQAPESGSSAPQPGSAPSAEPADDATSGKKAGGSGASPPGKGPGSAGPPGRNR